MTKLPTLSEGKAPYPPSDNVLHYWLRIRKVRQPETDERTVDDRSHLKKLLDHMAEIDKAGKCENSQH